MIKNKKIWIKHIKLSNLLHWKKISMKK